MSNEQKIDLIKHYLSQPNCVGVEMTRIEEGKEVTQTLRKMVNLLPELEIIGDPKPIAIELDMLKVGDEVWCKGDMGIVVETPATAPDDDYEYEIRLYGGGYSYGQRHELIKAKSEVSDETTG